MSINSRWQALACWSVHTSQSIAKSHEEELAGRLWQTPSSLGLCQQGKRKAWSRALTAVSAPLRCLGCSITLPVQHKTDGNLMGIQQPKSFRIHVPLWVQSCTTSPANTSATHPQYEQGACEHLSQTPSLINLSAVCTSSAAETAPKTTHYSMTAPSLLHRMQHRSSPALVLVLGRPARLAYSVLSWAERCLTSPELHQHWQGPGRHSQHTSASVFATPQRPRKHPNAQTFPPCPLPALTASSLSSRLS